MRTSRRRTEEKPVISPYAEVLLQAGERPARKISPDARPPVKGRRDRLFAPVRDGCRPISTSGETRLDICSEKGERGPAPGGTRRHAPDAGGRRTQDAPVKDALRTRIDRRPHPSGIRGGRNRAAGICGIARDDPAHSKVGARVKTSNGRTKVRIGVGPRVEASKRPTKVFLEEAFSDEGVRGPRLTRLKSTEGL